MKNLICSALHTACMQRNTVVLGLTLKTQVMAIILNYAFIILKQHHAALAKVNNGGLKILE